MGKVGLLPAPGKALCRLFIGLTFILLAPVIHAGNEPDRSTQGGTVVTSDATGTSDPDEINKSAKDKKAARKDAERGELVQLGEVTITGKITNEAAVNMPSVVETLSAEGIERINAVETADVFKYMPGSYLRKLYPGATNSPLVIRGNNSTMTGRTEVLMDGIRISDFTAAGHSNGPKWFLVAPREIERVDLIYGPFSAALSGNSMSGTAMITTHYPDKMEIGADAKYFYQNFHEYNTDQGMHGYETYGSFGNKTGRFSYNFWYNRLETRVQSVSYVTKEVASGGAPSGNPVTGWLEDLDPSGKPRFILGAAGTKDIINNTYKVKLAYDLTPESQIRFVNAFWDSTQNGFSPETYLRDARGNPVYSGNVDLGGVGYNLGATTFGYSKSKSEDMINALIYSLDMPDGWKVNASASSYDKLKDITYSSGTEPPLSKSGGAGTFTDRDSGWYTADLRAAHDIECFGVHTFAAGYHFDRYSTFSETWNTPNWLREVRTTLDQGSEGKTMTNALFVEDTWKILEKWSVYLGGRYEWWKGFDGSKSTDDNTARIIAPLEDRSENDFSPKLSTTYSPNEKWRIRASFGLATRYPTVGELFYGGVTSSGIINDSNPNLKPERSFAKDFTITRTIGKDGEARLTFFEDEVEDAIFSQTNTLTQVTNYQNVDEVRTRGIEFALNKRRVLIDGLGIFTNVAWTNSKILRNDNVPDSVGKEFPRVPEWRVKCALDYAPTDRWSVTFAGHYSGEQFGKLDNSDTLGGYGGVDEFLVFDARISYRFDKGITASLGVDNITDELYHISHPYPRRTIFAELKWLY